MRSRDHSVRLVARNSCCCFPCAIGNPASAALANSRCRLRGPAMVVHPCMDSDDRVDRVLDTPIQNSCIRAEVHRTGHRWINLEVWQYENHWPTKPIPYCPRRPKGTAEVCPRHLSLAPAHTARATRLFRRHQGIIIACRPFPRRHAPDTRKGFAPRARPLLEMRVQRSVLSNARVAKKHCPRNFSCELPHRECRSVTAGTALPRVA